MSQPNYCYHPYPTSHPDSPESGEDKVTLTRRKNAEAQKLYRERKKAQEAGLVNEVQILKQKIAILEAQLAYERQQSPMVPYPQPQYGYVQTNHAGGYSPDQDMFAPLDRNIAKHTNMANALFLTTGVPTGF